MWGHPELVELICNKEENDILIERRYAFFNNKEDVPEDLNAVNGGELHGIFHLNEGKLNADLGVFNPEEC